MLSLGIPGSGTTAVMMGALLMLGLQPGPMLFQNHPDIAWGLIASMVVGNVILAVINIPMAGALVRVLAIPPQILYPIILGLAFIGTYAISNSVIDFYIMVVFGIVGYFMDKAKIPSAPFILAIIVGNMMEISFRQALVISDGSWGIFVGSPIAIVLLSLTIISIVLPFMKGNKIFNRKKATVDK